MVKSTRRPLEQVFIHHVKTGIDRFAYLRTVSALRSGSDSGAFSRAPADFGGARGYVPGHGRARRRSVGRDLAVRKYDRLVKRRVPSGPIDHADVRDGNDFGVEACGERNYRRAEQTPAERHTLAFFGGLGALGGRGAKTRPRRHALTGRRQPW